MFIKLWIAVAATIFVFLGFVFNDELDSTLEGLILMGIGLLISIFISLCLVGLIFIWIWAIP